MQQPLTVMRMALLHASQQQRGATAKRLATHPKKTTTLSLNGLLLLRVLQSSILRYNGDCDSITTARIDIDITILMSR